jgi:hypothetical protein
VDITNDTTGHAIATRTRWDHDVRRDARRLSIWRPMTPQGSHRDEGRDRRHAQVELPAGDLHPGVDKTDPDTLIGEHGGGSASTDPRAETRADSWIDIESAKAASFDYVAPTTSDEAVSVLGERDAAKVPVRRAGLVPPGDAAGTPEPGRHQRHQRSGRHPAETASSPGAPRQSAVERTRRMEALPPSRRPPRLAMAIRNRTVGGSVAHADPAAEWPHCRWR